MGENMKIEDLENSVKEEHESAVSKKIGLFFLAAFLAVVTALVIFL